jgi:hypothetical protein
MTPTDPNMIWLYLLVSVALGNASGLLIKLLADKLNSRDRLNNGGMDIPQEILSQLCPRSEHEARLKAIEDCITSLKKAHSGMKAAFEAHLANITRQLEEGHDNFDNIRKDINRLTEAIVRLTVK